MFGLPGERDAFAGVLSLFVWATVFAKVEEDKMSTFQKKMMIVAVIGFGAQSVNADFTLHGNEHLNVTTNLGNGWLYDNSSVDVQQGGFVINMWAFDTSTVNISSGGYVGGLNANGASIVTIRGGDMGFLNAQEASITTFFAYDVELFDGLSFDGNEILGTGSLTGKWFDGTPFAESVWKHEPDAHIFLVPEPTTLSLLALGSLAILRRQRQC